MVINVLLPIFSVILLCLCRHESRRRISNYRNFSLLLLGGEQKKFASPRLKTLIRKL